MLQSVYDFFGIAGVDTVAPSTMGELITWLVQVVVALVLVSITFRVIGAIVAAIATAFRRL